MTTQGLPKILVIFAHPDPQESVANREMLASIADLPHVTIHDLYGSQCVRLLKGDFNQRTNYSASPLDQSQIPSYFQS